MEYKPFENRIYISSPTMHGEELKYITDAYNTNWVSTIGENIDAIEKSFADMLGCKYAVALSNCTSALHLAVRVLAEKIYGESENCRGALYGKKVFASDLTFVATVNPICYEDGEVVFIDSEYDTWNMDPKALSRAFEIYPDVRIVVLAHLYGTPAKLDEIKAICKKHGAVLIEDAAESLGASYKGKLTGGFGDVSTISFNGNKIITGSCGGMFVTDNAEEAALVRKWSTQCRENTSWYQHKDVGYNYRMSNIVAGIVRGQIPHLSEHIEQKKRIYERYKEAFKELPVSMNPFDKEDSDPNFWLSCIIIDRDAMCQQERTDYLASFVTEKGKTCPTEILEAIEKCNAEGRPIWKPLHMQPVYKDNGFVTAADGSQSIGEDIFERGLCLPSDNKMTPEQQDIIIDIVKSCFK